MYFQKTKIQYASDLHLEFPKNKQFFKANPLIPSADLLVLAGDIMPFVEIKKHDDFFDYLADNFEMTYWIPGNHEYYHFEATAKAGTFFEKIRSNVVLLNNSVVHYNDVKLLFSTLWSKVSAANKYEVERGHNDFRAISYNGSILTAEGFNALHLDCLHFLKTELEKKSAAKTVVVTHHVPTFTNYPAIYSGSSITEAFAVELSQIIEMTNPNFWIYGHNHFNTPEFEIGTTKLLTNQLGYVQLYENDFFERSKTLEI